MMIEGVTYKHADHLKFHQLLVGLHACNLCLPDFLLVVRGRRACYFASLG